MHLPFNLDAKSVIVGVIFALYVLPWILGKFHSRSKAA